MIDTSLEYARQQDLADPLANYRDEFYIPPHQQRQQYYFAGNSLGLQPKQLASYIQAELKAWRELGVAAHFEGEHPWMPYHELLRESLASITGALPIEVVAMNTLTTNLHLMLVSFFRPQGKRSKIVIEKQAFPSDRYAVVSQLQHHNLDIEKNLVELVNPNNRLLDESTIEDYLAKHGDEVALLLMPGVQYASGQVLDIKRITKAAQLAGAMIGFDLAHAVGNIPLNLHDDGCDFAVWCSYKYLNSGPGNIAGCFVHQRHSADDSLKRFSGWWGHDKSSRFSMGENFIPSAGADAWQLSNPSILGLAALRASLDIFTRAGMPALRKKSLQLTGYLRALVNEGLSQHIEIITPAAQHGCQLSLRLKAGQQYGKRLFQQLEADGFIGDWREPDILRISPTPLYNSFEDVWQLVNYIRQYISRRVPQA